MNQNPLISVIIPAYNCEKTIAIAIKSILNQTYKNIEIIVVDDRSTDETKKIAQKFTTEHPNIKIIDGEDDPERFNTKLNRNVNAGWSARNTGFKFAHGEYITFQDADDASLLNRIEIQYQFLQKYKSTHLSIDWVQFDEKYISKKFNIDSFSKNEIKVTGPEELYIMSQRSKGLVAKISQSLNKKIPFHIKRKRILNKFFFGTLENYPGPGNSPLFRREVIDRVQFRHLRNRIWPSFMGRGADKDFNFQVAETFKNSHVVFVPLYLWRVPNDNPMYSGEMEKYLIL